MELCWLNEDSRLEVLSIFSLIFFYCFILDFVDSIYRVLLW